MTTNKTVIKWLDEMKELLTPDNVVWVDGTPLGEVLVSSVKDITDNLAKYVAGQEVTEVW